MPKYLSAQYIFRSVLLLSMPLQVVLYIVTFYYRFFYQTLFVCYVYLFVYFSCLSLLLIVNACFLTRYSYLARESQYETWNASPTSSYDIDINGVGENLRDPHPLHANGAWFGGLQREIKLRYSQYWSDIKDGFHIQCLASLFYLAISLTATCLTYGQVICKYTMGNLGPVEMLSATSLSCILMAILATDPMSVIAGTATMLIVEASTYQVSVKCSWCYK